MSDPRTAQGAGFQEVAEAAARMAQLRAEMGVSCCELADVDEAPAYAPRGCPDCVRRLDLVAAGGGAYMRRPAQLAPVVATARPMTDAEVDTMGRVRRAGGRMSSVDRLTAALGDNSSNLRSRERAAKTGG